MNVALLCNSLYFYWTLFISYGVLQATLGTVGFTECKRSHGRVLSTAGML